MKTGLSFLATVLSLSLMIATAPAATAQQIQPSEPEWLSQLYEQGWHKVQEGVLQRATGGGQIETFGYGSEGLHWVVQGYEQRLDLLEEKYEQTPTAYLAAVIEQLKTEIARLSGQLPAARSAQRFDSEAMTTCAPSFGGEASAGPQPGAPGAKASASAYFYDDCGHLGDTFATAYAHAIAGTVETTVIQSDPKNGGTWLDSQAVASANGSAGCESWSQASVTSSELDIVYQTPLSQSFLCNAPSTKIALGPSNATLDGPQSDGDPGLLLDEQAAAGDPRAGYRPDLTTVWNTIFNPHVNAAIIDLGAVYRIERIYLYDTHGVAGGTDGDFTVTAGSASSGWTNTLISDPMPFWKVWKGFPNDPTNDGGFFVDDPTLELGVVTRYLRLVNPTGYVGMPEIVVYGKRALAADAEPCLDSCSCTGGCIDVPD